MPAGIDLIIGGHSHTKVAKEQVFNGVLITQAENKLKYGTLITLTVKTGGSIQRKMELIDIRNSKNEKAPIRAMVDKYNDNPVLKQVIATASDDFSSYEEVGYLMADVQRDAAGADIALVNPGGVRLDHLAKGPIAIMNVYQFDPFGNELVVTKLTGNEIHDLLIAAFPVDDRLPVYPSGIRTMLKVGSDGNLTDVTLQTESGSPLDMNKIYTVAMNDYMTLVYKYNHSDPGQSLFISTADATIAYLKRIQNIRSYRGGKKGAVRLARISCHAVVRSFGSRKAGDFYFSRYRPTSSRPLIHMGFCLMIFLYAGHFLSCIAGRYPMLERNSFTISPPVKVNVFLNSFTHSARVFG